MPVHPGRFWHQEGGRFRCDLCPRACLLLSGEQGFCYVREGSDDGILLTTYGRTSGACLDPIESKPLFHFYPGTAALSLGTAGCNLGCSHCRNWQHGYAHALLQSSQPASPEDVARVARAVGARSVAFTYNDPVVFAEYAIDTARACRAVGVKTVAVTSGYMTAAARPEFFAALDAASIDLKAFSDSFYREQCGGHLQPVLDTIEYAVRQARTWVELTTLLIPGLNDTDAEIDRLTEWIGATLGPDTPLHFNAFRPAGDLADPIDRQPTRLATLGRARERARAAGLNNVYLGTGRSEEATFCRGCHSLVIWRQAGRIATWRLSNGRCLVCGVEVAGCFDPAPGEWGELRVPVAISPKAAQLPSNRHEVG